MNSRRVILPLGSRSRRETFSNVGSFAAFILVFVSASTCLGNGWVQQVGGNGVDLFGVDMVDPERALIVGAGGSVIRTTNGGVLWSLESSGTSYDLYGVSTNESGLALAVGQAGTILRSTDGGTAWSLINQAEQQWDVFRSVHLLNDGFAIAVGADATLGPWSAVSTDGGVSWNVHSFLIDDSRGILNDVFAVSSQTQFAAGYSSDGRGVILRSVNGGQSWTPVLFTASTIFSITFPSPSVGYASSFGGLVYRTTDGGSTWVTLQSGTNQPGYGLAFPQPDAGWVVGTFSALERTVDSGEHWIDQSPGGLELNSVDFANELVGTVVGIYGRILRTESAGHDPAGLEEDAAPPNESMHLSSVGPNPFQSQATLSYRLDQPSSVVIEVFDPLGRSVFQDREDVRPAGVHQWSFRSEDVHGATLASGAYWFRLRAGAKDEAALKLVLLRD